ncbi:hypothetical protein BC833DRAFT_598923 [Globomyces pollinis-pini]|nr:hypothetical protein BC833DRAFT_598923 [Globomyces pollinis-pini]
MIEIQMRLLQCSKQYTINNCDSVVSIAPHMATVCQEWQACMQSNPTHVNQY